MSNNNKILVIGGSGFVGSRLLEILKSESYQNLDKNPSPYFNKKTIIGDITNKNDIHIPKNTTTIVLLAAEHRDDVYPASMYYKVNVEGTKNVLKRMDESSIKHLIFTSSVAVYGLNKKSPDERHPSLPFNHYGKSKWDAEKEIRDWYFKDPDGKSITIIRPTVIFGERNRGNVYNFFKQISTNRFLMIGKGQNKKSIAYVGNVVAFIKDRIERKEEGYHIFNYADKPDFTIKQLTTVIENKLNCNVPNIYIPYIFGILVGYIFDLIAFVSNKKLSISSVRIKKFCATTQFDSTKVHSVFNAPYTLETGLNKTLEFEFISPKEDDTLFYTE